MDYRDSPQEAAFRDRLRRWLAERAGEFPTSGDEYWARQGEWHRALYAAGFFGLSWPREYGGQELPPVYDVILDEELVSCGWQFLCLPGDPGRHGAAGRQERFSPQAEPGDRASRTSGSGGRTVDLLLTRREH